MTAESPAPRRSIQILAWALLLVSLHQVYVFLSLTLAARDVDLWFFFSSDTVQYGLLYQDLFDLGFHYAGWNISHAPEYLQMLWALLLRAATPSLATGHVLEAMAQPLLLAVALHRLLSRVWGAGTVLAPLSVAAILTLIAQGLGLDFIAFVWSNRHGFTALISVIGLSLLVDTMGARARSRSLTLGLIVSLGVASDLLFLVWFVVPALSALILLAKPSEHRARVARAVVTILGGAFLGLVLFWIATPVSTVGEKVGIDLARTVGSLGRMADDLLQPTSAQRALGALLISGLTMAVLAVWRSHRIEVRLLAGYATVLPVATVLAMALTAAPFREAGYSRYLLGPELGSLVTLVIGISGVHRGLGERLPLALLAMAIASGFKLLPTNITPISRYEPPLVKCIDVVASKHDLHYGVADYWLAKYITAFSNTDLRVMSVTPRLDPFPNFNNIEWFLGGVRARRHDRPEYTFAILGSATPDGSGVSQVALNTLGPPLAVESCFGYRIEVLAQGSNERIRAQFAQNRRIRAYYEKRGLTVPAP